MINAKNAPIDVEEIRIWANGYRELPDPPVSWDLFSKECGVPAGTLQPFCKGTYQGRNDRVARELFMFRQAVESRAHRQQAIPSDPGYFETESSLRIRTCLEIAHMGRITVVATGPGTGKSMTLKDYAERAQPVWTATMRPSASTLKPMVLAVHEAFGLEPRNQHLFSAARIVIERMRGRAGLLVIDEANHLGIDGFEELRSWHDQTGVGICLMGNEELLQRIESGRHRDQFARLNRRIAQKHVQRVPMKDDIEAFCAAWGLTEPGIRKYLEKIALVPGSGGLGECKMLVEAGSMIAAGEERGLTLADLRDAQMSRATRWIEA